MVKRAKLPFASAMTWRFPQKWLVEFFASVRGSVGDSGAGCPASSCLCLGIRVRVSSLQLLLLGIRAWGIKIAVGRGGAGLPHVLTNSCCKLGTWSGIRSRSERISCAARLVSRTTVAHAGQSPRRAGAVMLHPAELSVSVTLAWLGSHTAILVPKWQSTLLMAARQKSVLLSPVELYLLCSVTYTH